ncbi:hypothetical protein LTR10_019824 [Elasticomyces elasticus]|uniref:Uncharacterized protein n=1 Tax=Exophiala sideris TaxID=1016849 RepID=A0ABR0J182_9EURO|nr:hypothetical protein LTR10_019824 [Elasticomyces elasticus]KAK5024408.1 hypothetical protein LTS07_008699 [Exophiala sideris]KAK5030910.1 hypothetical protein LTR13_007923 [Exophiala sideris]KAK5054141.1 hypothetical protein LTR69_009103 [Exophiala sideris]KAK5179503.1 hypothetical protein LTR44_008019 [Eurotiomycetes sp. CCFEE 6388]
MSNPTNPKPPIPPSKVNKRNWPPEGHPAPGPGQLFHGQAEGDDPNLTATGTTPPPSSVYGNLQPHSGGPGQPGYPFFGATHADGDKSGLFTQDAPGLATGPAGNPPAEVRGPVTDFYGSADRHGMGPMQPPVFNKFATMRDPEKQQEVNSALNQTAGDGPLHMGSSGFGASHGGVPLTTHDGIHTSRADSLPHATIDLDSSFSADGRTHLYKDGSSSTVAPQQPGETGNRTFNYVPGQVGYAVHGPLGPNQQPVQETNESGTGSFYPDPSQAAKAAGG